MTLKDRFTLLTTKKEKSITSAAFILGITFLFSALLGLWRNNVLYSFFLKNYVNELDAYVAAFRIPDLIFKLLFTGALSASFIPVFSSYLHKDKKTAYRLASTVVNGLLILFLVLSLIIFIFASPLCHLIVNNFSQHQLDIMINSTRILMLSQIFFLISNFFTATLQVNQIFLIPSLSPIVYNFFIILGLYTLTPTFGIYGPVIGAVVGAFFHLAIQIPVLLKTGFKYTLTLDFTIKGVKEIIRLMIPRSVSMGLGEIENTVILFFASSLVAGSISILNLSLQLMYLPSRVFGATVGQATLPILSKKIARNKLISFRKIVNKTILQSYYISLPITVLILINRIPIVRLAFGSKEFPWSATLLTAKTLAFLTPAIACQAVIQILIRSFYAMHDTKTPLKISLFSLLNNIITSFIFVKYTNLGIVGLSISVSLGNLIQCLGLFIYYKHKVLNFSWGQVLPSISKITLASFFSGATTWLIIKIFDLYVLDTSKTLHLFILFSISSIIAISVYVFASEILKINEYVQLKRYFKTKISSLSLKKTLY